MRNVAGEASLTRSINSDRADQVVPGTVLAGWDREGREAEAECGPVYNQMCRMHDPLQFALEEVRGDGLWPTG